MPAPKRRRAPRGSASPKTGGGSRAPPVAVAQDEDEDVNSEDISGEVRDDEFAGSADDDEAENDEPGWEEEPEDDEDVADKRLRIAREYLARVQQDVADRRGDDAGEEEDEDGVSAELQRDNLEDAGRLQRQIARLVDTSQAQHEMRFHRTQQLPVTSVALTRDESTCYVGSKDGTILQVDIESGQRRKFVSSYLDATEGKQRKQQKGKGRIPRDINSVAVSDDGTMVASAHSSGLVCVWDSRSGQRVARFPGHRGRVSCVKFREGTRTLYSGSYDRTVKVWSCDELAYIDTLYGHESEVRALCRCPRHLRAHEDAVHEVQVLAIDCLRRERPVSVGRDRTCRLWKIQESSHLVLRAPAVASSIECCCMVNGQMWVTGAEDGSLSLWSMLKRKPVYTVEMAHSSDSHGTAAGYACAWVSSLAMCRGSDVVASGAGDGFVRLWQLKDSNASMEPLLALPCRGFVNSLAVSRSCRFLVAGVGQEPRLGRWARNADSRNGIAICSIPLSNG
eukprot:scaffold382_cov380-Prasinococcus_capsulatus_cf.AAC.21